MSRQCRGYFATGALVLGMSRMGAGACCPAPLSAAASHIPGFGCTSSAYGPGGLAVRQRTEPLASVRGEVVPAAPPGRGPLLQAELLSQGWAHAAWRGEAAAGAAPAAGPPSCAAPGSQDGPGCRARARASAARAWPAARWATAACSAWRSASSCAASRARWRQLCQSPAPPQWQPPFPGTPRHQPRPVLSCACTRPAGCCSAARLQRLRGAQLPGALVRRRLGAAERVHGAQQLQRLAEVALAHRAALLRSHHGEPFVLLGCWSGHPKGRARHGRKPLHFALCTYGYRSGAACFPPVLQRPTEKPNTT